MTTYPEKPYGRGAYRRHIRLLNSPGKVEGWLADDAHGFSVCVSYQDGQISDIQGQAFRHPWQSCDGAISVLRQLIGAPVLANPRAYSQHTNPRSQCTHWFDLVGLAMAHACRNEKERHYEVCIPDMHNLQTELTLKRNDTTVLRLALDGKQITAPAPFTGQDISRGFAAWAQASLEGDLLEAALVLYRARFVSLARALYGGAVDKQADGPGAGMPTGVCYTYSEGIIEHAVKSVDYHRDFSDCEEQVLNFP